MIETIQRSSIISFPALGISLNPPASFRLFGREIYFYGVIIAIAFAVGILYCSGKCKKIGIKEDDVYDILIWMIPIGIIGARLYFVIFSIDYYLANPSEIIAVWEGGLAIYGGVIAGVVTIIIISRKKGIPSLKVLDLFITACILGQAIGRWGNFMNREAFGSETGVFCRMGLTAATGNTIFVHPTFLYESLWDLAGFFILNHRINGTRKYNGQCVYLYCLWYGLGRAWIEGLRTDSLFIPGTAIRVSQLLSIAFAVFGMLMLIKNRKRNEA